MKEYEIGYYNKPWDRTEWRTLATATSESIAKIIVIAMNEEYQKNGMSLKVRIK